MAVAAYVINGQYIGINLFLFLYMNKLFVILIIRTIKTTFKARSKFNCGRLYYYSLFFYSAMFNKLAASSAFKQATRRCFSTNVSLLGKKIIILG